MTCMPHGKPHANRHMLDIKPCGIDLAMCLTYAHRAEEGDVRLVDQVEVANWQTGRLEVFFEGSWGQICAFGFDATDADVACRQLGFGAGAVGPSRPDGMQNQSRFDAQRLVFPEVALTSPGCNGTEEKLFDCRPDTPRPAFERAVCLSAVEPGLTLACVTQAAAGTPPAGRPSVLSPLKRWNKLYMLCHIVLAIAGDCCNMR